MSRVSGSSDGVYYKQRIKEAEKKCRADKRRYRELAKTCIANDKETRMFHIKNLDKSIKAVSKGRPRWVPRDEAALEFLGSLKNK